MLGNAALPALPGLIEFKGSSFHSARWDPSYDPRGRRVAVVGTGASAIQIVPAIADQVERMKAELETLDGQLDKFNADITQLQSKLNDAKTRQRSIVIRHKTASSQLSARKHIHSDRLDEMLFDLESAERDIDCGESEAD